MITLSSVEALIAQARNHGVRRHRMVLVVDMSPSQYAFLPEFLRQLNRLFSGSSYCSNSPSLTKSSIYIGDSLIESFDSADSWCIQLFGTAKQLLGQESALAVVDWRSNVKQDIHRADDLGAIGGILVAGGLCVLLTDTESHQQSPFLQRLYQCSNQHSLYRFDLTKQLIDELACIELNSAIQNSAIQYTNDQQNAIQALVKVVTGHRRRPLVLTADRGRGKSTVVGLACAELLKMGKQNIAVTAHRPQALDAVFEHAQNALPESICKDRLIQWQQGEIRFIPIDQLLEQPCLNQPENDLDALFVDEAAAIPAPQLQQLLECYPRVAFTSTINGYEGTGRGFSIRFLPYLAEYFPQYQTHELKAPLRWAKGDPLEAWLFDVLLLDAEPKTLDHPESIKLDDIRYQLLSGAELIADELLLRQAFGLLVQAHYQTSPDDLARLLDDPAFFLLVASQSDTVLGVIMLCNEGSEKHDAELKAQITKGQRRPKGNLLLQQLTTQYGDSDCLDWQGYRVVRIAVMDELRRAGLGSQLLEQLKSIAVQQGYDFIGSSFAATEDVMAFWQKNHYQPALLGSKRDAASGCYSASVINPLNTKTARTIDNYRSYFTYQAFNHITSLWPKLTPELARVLFSLDQSQPIHLEFIEQQDRLTLKRFSQGECAYENAIPALKRVLDKAQSDANSELFELLYQRLIVGLSWQQCGFTGRKQGIGVMRELLAKSEKPTGTKLQDANFAQRSCPKGEAQGCAE